MATSEAARELPADAELHAVIDQLIESWAPSGTVQAEIQTKAVNINKLAAVFGLVSHAHVLARTAADLLAQEQTLQALPLVRTVYECAITAQWIVQMREGYEAFTNEEVRHRRQVVKTLEAGSTSLAARSAEFAPEHDELDLETNASMRNFRQVCDDLQPGGADAYLHYRLMSQLAHASTYIVDRYLEPVDVAPGVALRGAPKQPPAHSYLYLLACGLIWSGRAVDYLDLTKRRRSALRAAANALGITTDLKPSEAAWKAGRA